MIFAANLIQLIVEKMKPKIELRWKARFIIFITNFDNVSGTQEFPCEREFNLL